MIALFALAVLSLFRLFLTFRGFSGSLALWKVSHHRILFADGRLRSLKAPPGKLG